MWIEDCNTAFFNHKVHHDLHKVHYGLLCVHCASFVSLWLNFDPLSNKTYFKKLFVDGWTISWPDGADIAPETLYELAEKAGNTVNENLTPNS